jgi:rhodanese-related sulfurtransferase
MKKSIIAAILMLSIILMAFPVAAHEHEEGELSHHQDVENPLHEQIEAFLQSVPDNHGFVITTHELKHITEKTQDFIILDIRDTSYYQRNPTKNSINIPLASLHDRIHELPKDKKIYVVSDIDTNAAFAVFTLHTHGHTGWLVQDGIPKSHK